MATSTASAILRPSGKSISWDSGSSRGGTTNRRTTTFRCAGLSDLIGGDLLRPDLGQWLEDVERHKALAVYTPHEGGYEGRYLTRLRYQGYHFLDLSARGLGDPESTLTKIHRPHLGKQPIARWYFPPEVDYRLSLMPPKTKGLILWVIEAKFYQKLNCNSLLCFLHFALKLKVFAECGNWRNFVWRPLKEISGLSFSEEEATA